MSTTQKILYWVARLTTAVILLQTLFYKFTAAEESVYIFTTIGMEPWGRIGVGVVELIGSVLLVITATAWMGALISLGMAVGAIGMHLTILGIEVMNDGGQLFSYALLVALCSTYVLYLDRGKWKPLLRMITGKGKNS